MYVLENVKALCTLFGYSFFSLFQDSLKEFNSWITDESLQEFRYIQPGSYVLYYHCVIIHLEKARKDHGNRVVCASDLSYEEVSQVAKVSESEKHFIGLMGRSCNSIIWTTWTPSQRMSIKKQQWGALNRERVPQEAVSPSAVVNVVVASVRSNTALTRGLLDQKEVDMLVDSGSSISLIQEGVATAFSRQIERTPNEGKGCITLPLCLGKLQVNHNFVVVHSLIAPVILGVDFLQKYNLVLDFTSNPVSITPKTANERVALPKIMKPIMDTCKKAKISAVEAFDEPAGETIDSCAIPLFGKATVPAFDVPKCTNKLLLAVLEQHKDFSIR